MHSISDRNVLITGASMGIGVTIARTFAERGARLALVARSADKLEALGAELRTICPEVITLPADLADRETLHGIPDRVAAEFGPVDILVNNAVTEITAAYETLSVEEIERVSTLNLTAPMLLAHAFVPGMMARDTGHIVNVASLAGMTGVAFQETYCSTKHGLIGFTRSLRASLETRGSRVGVSVVCPGFVADTGWHHRNKSRFGLSTPPLAGELPAQAVADAVMDAVLLNKTEMIINKTPVRPLFVLATMSPRLHEWMARRFKFHEFYQNVAGLKGRDGEPE